MRNCATESFLTDPPTEEVRNIVNKGQRDFSVNIIKSLFDKYQKGSWSYNRICVLFVLTYFVSLKSISYVMYSFCHNRIRRVGRAKIKERNRCSQCSQHIHFPLKHIPVSNASIFWCSGRNRDRVSKSHGIFFSWKRFNQEILCFWKGLSGT